MVTSDVRVLQQPKGDGLFAFFALACGATWLLAAPLSWAWLQRVPPPSYAITCAGLSAFGPTFAAFVIARRQRRLSEVFGRWRTSPAWVVLALFSPMAFHLAAALLLFVAGGEPAQWFYPPKAAEQFAALLVFPLGEEFGWRGFAHPRVVARYGQVRGSLLLGTAWGLWHLAYSVRPDSGEIDPLLFAIGMIELPLYALLFAWMFERANRSMAVALAFHAGAHLDHLEAAQPVDLRLHAIHIAVVAVAAALAARSLSGHPPEPLASAS